MTSTTILTEDGRAVVAEGPRQFNWGAAIAGAVAATAVTFFLVTLGSGVGLALVSPTAKGAAAFLTLGAIYFFVSQAFGFTVGGYLVGRLIGPEVETSREEQFRAAAHGFVMWAVAVAAGLVIIGVSSLTAGSAIGSAAARPAAAPVGVSGYWLDLLFRPAANSAVVDADKAEAGRILAMDIPLAGGANDADSTRIARLVAQDANISMPAAMARVADVQTRMRQDATRTADEARKAASILALWTAFSLLFGAIVAVATAISARWMDDRISFGFAPRYR